MGVLLGYRRMLACCSRPRAARAVPSCAGAYVSGAAGSNVCPAGSVRIETEAACRTAVAFAGKTPSSTFVLPNSARPRGCYYESSGNDAWFNADAVGAGSSFYQLLCAALATAGAPPSHRRANMHAHTRTHIPSYGCG